MIEFTKKNMFNHRKFIFNTLALSILLELSLISLLTLLTNRSFTLVLLLIYPLVMKMFNSVQQIHLVK